MKEESLLSRVLAPVFSALISLAMLAGLGGLVIMAFKFFITQIKGVM
jgi:hypothetical protein